MGHRYYDARIGRFLTQDPAGDGDNWYSYCGNDPVDGVDPEGLSFGFGPIPFTQPGLGNAESTLDDGTYDETITTNGISSFFRTITVGTGFKHSLGGGGGGVPISVIIYQGFTPAETKKITHILNVINTTKRGHQLVSKARHSPRKYRIVKNSTGEADVPHGVIYFSFDINAPFDNVYGSDTATPTRILAHELGHIVGGEPIDGGPDHMSNVNANENPVMLELENGDIAALRTTYR